jgi:4-hydroxy-tetrahydrodipicolinate synthase
MKPITGVWTALVTPFDDQGAIDMSTYIRLLHRQARAGVAGVIPCGTTGEAPALTLDEKKLLIETALTELSGTATRVVAGTGSNNQALTLETSQWASDLGVDGVLVVTPYYNKPSQAGLMSHFTAVADAVACQVILYNVPSRTGVSFAPATIAALAEHPRITTLKEATGSMSYAADVMDHLQAAGRSLTLLSGDDATFFPFCCLGGEGGISVLANLCPEPMLELYHAVQRGDLSRAREIHRRYFPLFRDLFIECNPVPVKWAMMRAGLCSAVVRAPLASLEDANVKRLDATLAASPIDLVHA